MKRDHSHRPMSAFSRPLNARTRTLVWTCSVCGIQDVWRETWEYLGSLSCHKCGIEPAIDAVICSEACKRKYEAQSPAAREAGHSHADPLVNDGEIHKP